MRKQTFPIWVASSVSTWTTVHCLAATHPHAHSRMIACKRSPTHSHTHTLSVTHPHPFTIKFSTCPCGPPSAWGNRVCQEDKHIVSKEQARVHQINSFHSSPDLYHAIANYIITISQLDKCNGVPRQCSRPWADTPRLDGVPTMWRPPLPLSPPVNIKRGKLLPCDNKLHLHNLPAGQV
jgi:hypothetical protein